MLMNKTEFLLMNNPFRSFIQEQIEVKQLRSLSRLADNMNVLEIGCGNGTGTNLIEKYFKPKKITAVDLDEEMIKLAKKGKWSKNIVFKLGDATKLNFKDHTFDAVFDFGIIHHIPNWKDCLDELKRILKPSGELILEDLSIESFQSPLGKILRRILIHPYEQMYKRQEFLDYLEKIGFTILRKQTNYPLSTLKYFQVIARL